MYAVVRSPSFSRSLFAVVSVLALGACEPRPTTDAGPTPADAGRCEDRTPPALIAPTSLGVTVGTTRHFTIISDGNFCSSLELTFATSSSGMITTPSATTLETGRSNVELEITGVAVGQTTLTITSTSAGGTTTANIAVTVSDGTIPTCAGSGAGMVSPGGSVSATGGTIDGASVGVVAGAATSPEGHVDPFMVTIECDDDVVPDGFVPLGPAVSFTSATVYRFAREIDFALPLNLALLPAHLTRAHVEIAYMGPGVTTPRIVPIANPVFEGDAADGTFRFMAPRLGTYQVVSRAEPGVRVSRTLHYRGITGFSMGGSGTGRIGMGNPDLFDFIAPLGGPTDWQYLLEYIRNYHLGGFCTAEERAADPSECTEASLDHAPPALELFEHPQHFENWFYHDGWEGQGGSFNREDYIAIFRDLTAMFGNANHDASIDGSIPDVLPPGIPDSVRSMTDAERCAADPIVLTNFFDDEFNPDGTLPVITVCDGAELQDLPDDADGGSDVGHWDPEGNQRVPLEVGVAVDVNGNGERDAGEPIIRNGREPYDDFGCDRTASIDEVGYDALTNPDPSGDDFDFQYNPTGTEHNRSWDGCRTGGGMPEEFEDVGIDGVAGTCQMGSGPNCYDTGEGNGTFDRTRGAERMVASSPRAVVAGYEGNGGVLHEGADEEVLSRLGFFSDGGIRDLFNWAVMGDMTMAGWSARGFPVRFFNGHGALHMDGRSGIDFDGPTVPWDEVGRYSMVRYGSLDASESQLEAGDGGHVGTSDQLVSRIYSAVYAMGAAWPTLDRSRILDMPCREVDPGEGCEHVNVIDMNFRSPTTGREGPVTIVLPPGYFDPAYADVEYPVVYFLHGYGMEPGDLEGLGLLMWQDMIATRIPADLRLPKMIFVFPDGRCRNSECLRGTFYTDAPENNPTGARMQTFLLDLAEHMDTNYRTHGDEVVEFWE